MQIATIETGAIGEDGTHQTEILVEEGCKSGRIDKNISHRCVRADASKEHRDAMTCLGGRKLGEPPQKYT